MLSVNGRLNNKPVMMAPQAAPQRQANNRKDVAFGSGADFNMGKKMMAAAGLPVKDMLSKLVEKVAGIFSKA